MSLFEKYKTNKPIQKYNYNWHDFGTIYFLFNGLLFFILPLGLWFMSA